MSNTSDTERVHPDEPAEGRTDAGESPTSVTNDGTPAAAGDGHETGGGHDDLGKGSSGS